MTKTYSQAFMFFALLIFAAHSLASSSLLCKMTLSNNSQNTAAPQTLSPLCHTKPNKALQITTQQLQLPTQHFDATAQSTHSENCFYCIYKLCNSSLTTACFEFNLSTPLSNEPSTLKYSHYIEHINSAYANAPYRPPTFA